MQDVPVRIVSGMDGLLEVAAAEDIEVLVTGIVGMIGIRPTIAAIEAGKDIALANKETLVTAGAGGEDSAHGVRRSVPWKDPETACGYDGGGCIKAPQLVHGEEGNHRLRVTVQQGA